MCFYAYAQKKRRMSSAATFKGIEGSKYKLSPDILTKGLLHEQKYGTALIFKKHYIMMI